MNKKGLFFAFAVLLIVSVHCFAQDSASKQRRALQGTWTIIAILGDEKDRDAVAAKLNDHVQQYSFRRDNMIIRADGVVMETVKFEVNNGILNLKTPKGDVDKLAYFVQDGLLIIREPDVTFVLRKLPQSDAQAE